MEVAYKSELVTRPRLLSPPFLTSPIFGVSSGSATRTARDREVPMSPQAPQLAPTRYQAPNPLLTKTIRVCPECSGPVVHNSGCITCRQCGWGRCG